MTLIRSILALLALGSGITSAFAQIAGGYSRASTTDKDVVAAAKFAVEAQAKVDKAEMKLVKVTAAATQVIAGQNFRMNLDVAVDGGTHKAEVVVWAKLDQTYQLTEWVWKGNFKPKGNAKAFPGKASDWNGFVKHDFQVDGTNVIVVSPKTALPGKPWLWRGEFFGAFPNADIELVKRGWHLVYMSVPNLFGSPKAIAKWEKFYDLLVKDYGFYAKPGLIGMSRGAMYCMGWAAAHPDKTLAVYLDAGVCDFKSWPGKKLKNSKSKGSEPEWQNVLKAFDFKDDAEALAFKGNPVDNLAALAKAKLPLLLVYGDKDEVVPHDENSEIVFERYKELGGKPERIIKPGIGHHPHGLSDPKPIVEFFTKSLAGQN